MSLTSPALQYLLAALSVGLLARVLLGWPRMAGRGWRAIAARTASLLLLQTCVLLWIFVTVNRSAVFYASWSDLFGSVNATGHLASPSRSAAATERPLVANGSARVRVRGVHAAGTLQAVTFHGQLSGLTVPGHLYLPPGYRPGVKTRYPVIVDISASAASPSSPYGAAQLAQSAAMQIAAGKLSPVVVVMLPAALGSGDESCLNVPAQSRPGAPALPPSQAQTFMTDDLPATLESAYSVSASRGNWALLGDSTGGYCVLQLALSSPWDFSTVVAPRRDYSGPPGTSLASATALLRRQYNLIWLVQHEPLPPISILFAGPGRVSAAGPVSPFLTVARPPMRVSMTELSNGSSPLAPVLAWIGRSINGQQARSSAS